MNIFNSLLAQLVKYDVHTTRKINFIHAIFYHILSFYFIFVGVKKDSDLGDFDSVAPEACIHHLWH